jgi:hypothetical protein
LHRFLAPIAVTFQALLAVLTVHYISEKSMNRRASKKQLDCSKLHDSTDQGGEYGCDNSRLRRHRDIEKVEDQRDFERKI